MRSEISIFGGRKFINVRDIFFHRPTGPLTSYECKKMKGKHRHSAKGCPDRHSETAGREGGSAARLENFLSTHLQDGIF